MARKRSGSAPQPTIHSGRDRGPDHAGPRGTGFAQDEPGRWGQLRRMRGTGRYVTGGLAGQPSRLRKHRGGR
jgi:hypothetical protein